MLFVIYGVIKGFTVRSITTLDPKLLLLTFCVLAKHWSNLSTSPTTHGTLYSLFFSQRQYFLLFNETHISCSWPLVRKKKPHMSTQTGSHQQNTSKRFLSGNFLHWLLLCFHLLPIFPKQHYRYEKIEEPLKLSRFWNL